MTDPRRASVKCLALLTLAFLAAALPPKHAAQSAPSKPQSLNGRIVFQSTQGSDFNDIYTMDAEGKHQTRLTDDPGDDVSAVWSPQGTQLAFLSDRRGVGYEVYLMGADGSNQRPLRAASPVYTSAFVWSPDGTRLAYADGGDVFVAQVEGTDAPVNVSVNKPAGSSDGQPGWSPNGGQLVVLNFTQCGGCSDVHVVNAADGGGRVALSTGPGFDANPTWSPAGNLIAYEGDRGGRGIYVTAADGTGTEVKVSGAVESFGPPTWSPDGTLLAFRALTGNKIHVAKADGTSLTAVSDVLSSGGGGIFWSPDGSMVGFHDANADNMVDVFVVNADGTSRRAANYTKTKRADEFASSWQKVTGQ